MQKQQSDSTSAPNPRLPHTCRACASAFGADLATCPCCDESRPESGWTTTSELSDRWLGREVGRYRLRSRVGLGSTGTVYRAVDRRLRESYAVKLIDFADLEDDEAPQVREQMRREVEILCNVSSPHTVGFHDFLTISEDAAAIVMEYVDGRTLRQQLSDSGPFTVSQALQTTREIASGMSHAHACRAVHRDLKPGNVMLQRRDGGGEIVRVIDFGTVEFIDRDEEIVGFVGTPQYASPEQARCNSIDHRSDIYSLGCLLFSLLTGDLPFDYESPRQHLVAHSREETPTPSSTGPDAELPREVQLHVLDLMAKDPEDRPDSMVEVADRTVALQTKLHEGGEQARPRAG